MTNLMMADEVPQNQQNSENFEGGEAQEGTSGLGEESRIHRIMSDSADQSTPENEQIVTKMVVGTRQRGVEQGNLAETTEQIYRNQVAMNDMDADQVGLDHLLNSNAILYMPRTKPIISSQRTRINDILSNQQLGPQALQNNSALSQFSSKNQQRGTDNLGRNNQSILRKNDMRIKSTFKNYQQQIGGNRVHDANSLLVNNKLQEYSQMSVVDRLTQEKPHQRVRSVLSTMMGTSAGAKNGSDIIQFQQNYKKGIGTGRKPTEAQDLVLPNLNNNQGVAVGQQSSFGEILTSRKQSTINFLFNNSPSGRSVNHQKLFGGADSKKTRSEILSVNQSPRFQSIAYDGYRQVLGDNETSNQKRSPPSQTTNCDLQLPMVGSGFNTFERVSEHVSHFHKRSRSQVHNNQNIKTSSHVSSLKGQLINNNFANQNKIDESERQIRAASVLSDIQQKKEHLTNAYEATKVFQSELVPSRSKKKPIIGSKVISMGDLSKQISKKRLNQSQITASNRRIQAINTQNEQIQANMNQKQPIQNQTNFLQIQSQLAQSIQNQRKKRQKELLNQGKAGPLSLENEALTFENLKQQLVDINENNEKLLQEMKLGGKIYTNDDEEQDQQEALQGDGKSLKEDDDGASLSNQKQFPEYENEYQGIIDKNDQRARLKKMNQLKQDVSVAKDISNQIAAQFQRAKTKIQMKKNMKAVVEGRVSEMIDDDGLVKPQYKMIDGQMRLVKDYGQDKGFKAYAVNEKYYTDKSNFKIKFGEMPPPKTDPLVPLTHLAALRGGIKQRLSQINQVENQLKDYQLKMESKTRDLDDSSYKSEASEDVANLKNGVEQSLSPIKVERGPEDLGVNQLKQINSDDSDASDDSFFDQKNSVKFQKNEILVGSPLKTLISPPKFKVSNQHQGQVTNFNNSPFKLNTSVHDIPNSAVTLDRGLRASPKLRARASCKSNEPTGDGEQTVKILQLQDSPEIKLLKNKLQNLEKNEDTEQLRRYTRNIKKQTLIELKEVEKVIKDQSDELMLLEDSRSQLSPLKQFSIGRNSHFIYDSPRLRSNGNLKIQQRVSGFDQQSIEKCPVPQDDPHFKKEQSQSQLRTSKVSLETMKSQALRIQVQSSVLPVDLMEVYQQIEQPSDDIHSSMSSLDEIHDNFEDKLKKIKLTEMELESMPLVKKERDKIIEESKKQRKNQQWQQRFEYLAQKHSIENNKATRHRKPEEDMKKLEELENLIRKQSQAADAERQREKFKKKMKQQYVGKSNVISQVLEDNTVAKIMRDKFTLLQNMAYDDIQEASVEDDSESENDNDEMNDSAPYKFIPNFIHSNQVKTEINQENEVDNNSYVHNSPINKQETIDKKQEEYQKLDQLQIVEDIDQKEKGMRALIHYQEVFMHVQKLADDFKYVQKEIKSPLIQFLVCLEQQKIKVNPKTFGFLLKKDVGQMNLQSFLITDIYIDAFVKSITLCNKLQILNISRTGLGQQNAIKIIKNLPHNLKELNMSYNSQFGPEAANALSQQVLNNKDYNQLVHLNIEGCNIGDLGCEYVCHHLKKGDESGQSQLRILNLSNNNIRKRGGQILGGLIRDNKNLTMIFLHWNPLGGDASLSIAKGLQANQYLQVLDLSFCALGAKRVHGQKGKAAPYDFSGSDGGKQATGGLQIGMTSINEKVSEVNDPDPIVMPQFNKLLPEQIEALGPEEKKDYEAKYLKFCESKREYKHKVNKLPFRKKPYIQLDYSSAQEWSNAFKINNDLIHLDLSHNNFDTRELQIMNQGLNLNQSLFGLHIKGNEGFLDAKGFVRVQDRQANLKLQEFSQYSEFTRIQPKLKMGIIKNPHKRLDKLNINANCWICEGWQEYDFEFRPRFFVDPTISPVKLHLSCDNFEGYILQHFEENVEMTVQQPSPDKGLLIRKIQTHNVSDNSMIQGDGPAGQGQDGKGKGNILAMKMLETLKQKLRQKLSVTLKQKVFFDKRHLPPGQIFYYFTIDGKVVLDDNAPQINIFGKNAHVKIDMRVKSKLVELNVPRTNVIAKVKQCKKMITHTFIDRILAKPRPKPFEMETLQRKKSAWDISKSIFKSYRQDTEEIINLCFETDWSLSKCEKVLRENKYNIKMVKNYLRQVYKHIKETYKAYSGLHPFDRVTCLSTNDIVECLKNCSNLIDQKTVKLADIDLQFIACNSKVDKKKAANDLNPEKQLVRYQFLEILIRLAIDKYYKSGECKQFHEAVERAFETNYLAHFNDFDSAQFRWDKFYREENDIVLTRLQNGIRSIYMKICQQASQKRGKQVKFISIDDFVDMIIGADLYSDKLSSMQISQIFALSMQTNVNEVETDTHLQMTLFEFIEAIGRVADQFQLDQLDNYFPEHLPKSPFVLDKKIECIVLHLMQVYLPAQKFQQERDAYEAALGGA